MHNRKSLPISNSYMGSVLVFLKSLIVGSSGPRNVRLSTYSGRAEEAIALYKKAIRVNPIPPSSLLTMLGSAYRSASRYEEAISTFKKGLHINPSDMFAHLGLASVYSLLGRKEDARAEATEVLKIDPKFSLINMAKQIPYKDTTDRERYIDALRKAGLK